MMKIRTKNSGYPSYFYLLFLISYLLFLIAPVVTEATHDIEDVLKAYLKSNYPWAEIEINNLKLSTELPEDFPERIVIKKGPPGRTVFSLGFKNGKKVTATANVKAFDWVVMSGRAFKKGYVLQKDDVYVTLMDLTKIPKGAIRSVEYAVNKLLTRSIIANTPIADDMVGENTMVKKGRRVALLVESHGFSITAMGEIKENSYVGDYVKAINLSSKKVITGVLINGNTVKVEF